MYLKTTKESCSWVIKMLYSWLATPTRVKSQSKEIYIRQKRPTYETHKRDLWKRRTEETSKRDLQRRAILCDHRCCMSDSPLRHGYEESQKRPVYVKRDLYKRPVKKTYERDVWKKLIKETYQRELWSVMQNTVHKTLHSATRKT